MNSKKNLYRIFFSGIIIIGIMQILCSCDVSDAVLENLKAMGADVRKNKKVILKYIESNYGDDYEIVDKYLGNSGAGGRHDDILTISQDGITYKVSAKDGQITKDTYSEQYAGKMIGEMLIEKSADSVPDLASHDFELKCEVLLRKVIDKSSIKTEDMLDYQIDVQLIVKDITAADDIESQNWIYDFYKMTCENIPRLTLFVNIGENSKGTLLYTYGTTHNCSDRIFDRKEFFERFTPNF